MTFQLHGSAMAISRTGFMPRDVGQEGAECLGRAGIPFGHRRGVRIEVDEDEAVEQLEPDFGQADFRLVEARRLFGVARVAQPAVGRVGQAW